MPNNEYENEPNQSRSEDIISSILDGTEYDEPARSRIEYLLIQLKEAIEGGGGGGGVTSYSPLTEKPKIDNHTLQAGNNSSSDLGLQTKLTFDSAPTENSTNPVTSGGVYTALATKQDTLTVDSAPTENSTNPVQSGGVYTALEGKEDTLTFDNAPTNNSNNPVKSGGIYTALGQKQDTLTFDGTYSASTNAAATVSTVTNAIGALDVTGESGISASKTISAWSEADGKVSVSTQDIAIAGTQAVLTGYTPESPAQTDSILATDTVNAAIKKLDERSRVDENNILSLSPTAYTAPRPNTNYNITIDSGGYFLCGKICYINVRLTVGTDIPNNTYFMYDLPEALTPLAAGSSICALNNNRGVYISVASQGNVLNASGAAITAGQLL